MGHLKGVSAGCNETGCDGDGPLEGAHGGEDELLLAHVEQLAVTVRGTGSLRHDGGCWVVRVGGCCEGQVSQSAIAG